VRDMLREIANKTQAATGQSVLVATDYMDDGSLIQLSIKMDPVEASIICLFTNFIHSFNSFTIRHKRIRGAGR